ncbi:paraquat-inducible protein A [Pedobacter sp. AW1-32]|uniref:paraquat-inducible protein A n=1 Tax=Pedobacter sp. AW1-32 TaxID=3383026 RepID=UPI003FEFEAE0
MSTSNTIPENKQTGKNRFATIALITGLSVLLLGAAYFGFRFQQLSIEQKSVKEDYSLSNNITFGIFSVDRWGEKIASVVDRRVKGFNLTKQQKADMQNEVEKQLHNLINKAVKEVTKPQKSLGGKLKKLAFNSFVDVDEVHAQVPTFARTIVVKMTSRQSLERIKGIATSKMDELEAQTYDNSDTTITTVERNIYKKYHVNNKQAFENNINSRLAEIKKESVRFVLAMFACVAIAIVLWLLLRNKTQLHGVLFVMSLLFAFVLLCVGISSPIIEVDARIQTLEFSLLGDKLAFDNQVLFFQSKSILGIIKSLIEQPKPDAVLIGVLLLLFVILLPMLRLIARGLHVSCSHLFNNPKILRFLAFDLGKWDMADVMVVGIAMTYIGLNGILKSQLSGLNIQNDTLKTVTANNSALQLGFFVFVGYVVYAALLTLILKRIDKLNGPC